MPKIASTYNPPFPFKNGHFATIYSAKFRLLPRLIQQRERIELPDGDFIDVDWSFSEKTSQKVAILLHGLEGNAQRTYMKGIGKLLIKNGWDVAAINYRGCSGEMNKAYKSYNAGKTDDLDAVISFILKKDNYNEMELIGFSLGGNLLLKYLGERETLPKQIKKAVAISTPLSLKGSLDSLNEYQNWLYRTVFLNEMKRKYKEKIQQHPEKMDISDLKRINSLFDFDTVYTAPANGFKDAYDYYEKNSSLQFLPNIKIPVYILNAQNDSFLSPDCYPFELASKMKNLFLETPKYGGHVGFYKNDKIYYNEEKTMEFLNE